MQPRPLRLDRGCEHGIHFGPADLLNVAHRFLFAGREPAANVSFRRLGTKQVDALALDQIGVVIKHATEILAHLIANAARFDDILAAGEFAGFAEDERSPAFEQSLETATDGRT